LIPPSQTPRPAARLACPRRTPPVGASAHFPRATAARERTLTVTLVSRTARLPLSEIAVAQTVGGALRTARVIIKERSRHHKRATRSPQLLREPANGCPRRAALFKRGRRARLPRLSRDLGDGVGGDEAELRRAALRGSSSSERAKGGERRMMGQSLLLGQAARPRGERTQLLCLVRCWSE